MPGAEVPAASRAFIDATNRADSDAFVDAFTDDAHLYDYGREFSGHDGVRDWNRTDNIG
ncbi:nuclear transport factor 2 family protein [Streptomyces longwoodensis]|uniref:nuclear transport factor 2 family protein n=1 Tax=Streptomyces longwoodensis TaxID=68231 RepID=UPI0036F5D693